MDDNENKESPPSFQAQEAVLASQDNAAQRAWWLGQVRRNLPLLASCRDIRVIHDIFVDIPGIIVGAGPGIENNISLLAGAVREYPLFCCDRAAPRLRAAGVVPQFLVVADGSMRVTRFLENCDTARMVLIAPVYTHHTVFELPWRYKIVYAVVDPDESYNEAVRNIISMTGREFTAIPGGLVVGNQAFLCAKIAGCNPMTFVGNDLALESPEEAGGTFYRGTAPDGREVCTLPAFLAALEWISNFVKVDKDFECGKLKLYNSTEGGILYTDRIEGLPLQEFVERHPGAKKSLDTLIRRRF